MDSTGCNSCGCGRCSNSTAVELEPRFIYKGDFVSKPRMTQSDKWKKRKCVTDYWAFKNHVNLQANVAGYKMPNEISIEFRIPIPKSRKKDLKPGDTHQQKPDLDNLIKAVKDALLPEDSTVYKYGSMKKVWWSEPEIVFFK